MKKLMRMKLINWHRFENTTIHFGESTLLSGENGAGKSTLLDAIQFVITCSTNYFNKAAHENGKRKLTGYIRCKTGRENKPYERTGEISAHIALEFYEESKQQYFVVGAVVDSASEGQETTVRYLMDNTRFTADMFLDGNIPRSINNFRAANKKVKKWCKTQVEAKRMMQARFGRIEDKFFQLVPKAMAFKPINDIKDFVYSYVLDEKEVNIDILRENVRTYQEFEKTLESVKKRIEKLAIIEKHYQEVQDSMKKEKMYEFFLACVEVDILKESIEHAIGEVKSEEFRLQEENKKLKVLTDEKEEKQEVETNLRVELKNNKEFIALEEQKKELKRLQEDEKESEAEKRELKRIVKRTLDDVYKLQEIKDVAPSIHDYGEMLKNVEQITDIAKSKQIIEEVLTYKKRMFSQVQEKMAEVRITLEEQNRKRQETEKRMEQLKRKRLSYPESVNRVLDTIQEEFSKIDRSLEPRVLCELLEITDESWRNAVEGYLNTQRFYILVEPEHFDIALGIYDRLRKERKAYGVGLINTQKLEKYDDAQEGTLASVVTSKNIYAKRFINMMLGKVQMCSRFDELKKYPTSITKECMKYQNRVASAIKPMVFETPFIGSKAIKVQLQQAKEQYLQLEATIKESEKRLEQLHYVLSPLSTEHDIDIKYRIDVLGKLKRIQQAIGKCNDNIKTLEKNSTLIQKQIQLSALENIRKELEKDIAHSNQKIGGLQSKISGKKLEIKQAQARQMEQKNVVNEIASGALDELIFWEKEYKRHTEKKSFIQFKENYSKQQKTNETKRRNAEENMSEVMIQYKTDHDFGAAPNIQGYKEFAAVYDRLRTSELLNYEEKVRTARNAAEEEFREQFLAKLQENMKQAHSEFKELNKALKDIVFSNEKYEFLYMPSKRHRNYYEMIMDDFNAMQGESIFSGMFHETHKEVIDELFERLALDSENNAKTLDEFTDYRTYMDYDIRIIHNDGNYSFYSKVCEEKSGGETQTPFYVTVAASFVQLYGNNIGGEAIGLVMFDEAFNNMDDERIGGVLEFLERLPLQIIISAPPDKIQYISPVMEETLLVMTDEKVSYVEEYYNGAV